MMLAAYQEAVAALATDAALRRRYAEQGGAALAGFGLDAATLARVAAIGATALDRYADGLLAKRAAELVAALPLTARVAPELAAHHRAFLAAHPATAADGVLDPGLAEALRALPALIAALAADDAVPPWTADLLGFEASQRASATDGVVRGGRSAFAIHAVAAELRDGVIPLEVPREPHVYRFEGASVRARRAP